MSDKPDDTAASVWTTDVKTLTLIGPVLASALAVLYDVGFFTGLHIGFFTFFTLSEHLLFALQAIPFAALTAYSAGGFFFGSWLGARDTDKLLAKLQAEPDLEKRQALAAPYLARASSFGNRTSGNHVANHPNSRRCRWRLHVQRVGWKPDFWRC
ncbi:hypothetical protein [Bradyrhizobium sp. 35]|uniref:hypothetical protein n=1 Tax=Bradyrhizobium sp. 35 TaxID=2782670 RepID=UPI001FF74D27|nr:hypothetical protein [Bradyrhizobium sp. 35]